MLSWSKNSLWSKGLKCLQKFAKDNFRFCWFLVYTNGVVLLLWYNKLGMVNCIYWGVTGYNLEFQIIHRLRVMYPIINPYPAYLVFLFWKCHLLITSAAYIQMRSRPILSWKQTKWTLIRLLLREQSDLSPYWLQYRSQNIHKQKREQMTIVVNSGKGSYKLPNHDCSRRHTISFLDV